MRTQRWYTISNKPGFCHQQQHIHKMINGLLKISRTDLVRRDHGVANSIEHGWTKSQVCCNQISAVIAPPCSLLLSAQHVIRKRSFLYLDKADKNSNFVPHTHAVTMSVYHPHASMARPYRVCVLVASPLMVVVIRYHAHRVLQYHTATHCTSLKQMRFSLKQKAYALKGRPFLDKTVRHFVQHVIRKNDYASVPITNKRVSVECSWRDSGRWRQYTRELDG